MKKFFLLYLLPATLALAVFLLLRDPVKKYCFPRPASVVVDSNIHYIEDFRIHPGYEDLFLRNSGLSETIFLLGSSEMSVNSEAASYRFIPDHFQTDLKGIGHAGNQCFSIYCLLLAYQDRLKNAPVVIILSPGWFHSRSAAGTPSSIFLDYCTPAVLDRVCRCDSCGNFRRYAAERIADYYDEFTKPGKSIRQLYFDALSARSFFHSGLFSPVTGFYRLSDRFSTADSGIPDSASPEVRRIPIVPEIVAFSWDSLIRCSRQQQVENCTNNAWGIENDYYNEYIRGRTSTVTPVPESRNRELDDFRMLLLLLKARQARASFVILPLNPFYYTNLRELSPLIQSLEQQIHEKEFPCLNLWNDKPANTDKYLLKDVMHLSDYGWHQVNRFIIDTYTLSR